MAGMLSGGKLLRQRPFRAPHHSCSQAALVGGGTRARPGEISLAHGGVLFLDELPEFPRQTLEALRQPLESGEVTIARAHAHVTYPSQVQLVAAMNPCRCGYMGDSRRQCSRAPSCGRDYLNKLSGPLLDRFDLFVDVPPVHPKDLAATASQQSTASSFVAEYVQSLRVRQLERQGVLNAHLSVKDLNHHAGLHLEAKNLLVQAMERWGLSARSYHRAIKVARTIADWEGSDTIEKVHMGETLSYRLVVEGGSL